MIKQVMVKSRKYNLNNQLTLINFTILYVITYMIIFTNVLLVILSFKYFILYFDSFF